MKKLNGKFTNLRTRIQLKETDSVETIQNALTAAVFIYSILSNVFHKSRIAHLRARR